MRPQLYKARPVLLPYSVIEGDTAVQELMLSFMDDLCYAPMSKSLQVYVPNVLRRIDGSRISDRAEVRFPSIEERMELLKEPIPLYYDFGLVNGKLLAIGPYLPGLAGLIGQPKITLSSNKHSYNKEVSYYQETFIPPSGKGLKPIFSSAFSYLIIENLPGQLLAQPSDWHLQIEYQQFSHQIQLQPNPFHNLSKKLTLFAIQKNQPLEQLANWCNHYIQQHQVGRIVIYHNQATQQSDLPELKIKHPVELYYVEWDYSFQLRFPACQSGALTHANWLLRTAASYIMNFDPDEYLINHSGAPVEDYLKQHAKQGVRITGYEVPPSIPLPPRHDLATAAAVKFGAKEQGRASTKYIFAPGYWQALFTHSARRYSFWVNPGYWTMLNGSGKHYKFLLSRYLYGLDFFIGRILSSFLRMRRPDKQQIYYLHYRSLNTGWKWPQKFFARLDKDTQS